jgi:hypothetical protein
VTTLATTIDAWWPEVLGFLETGITNAPSSTVPLHPTITPGASQNERLAPSSSMSPVTETLLDSGVGQRSGGRKCGSRVELFEAIRRDHRRDGLWNRALADRHGVYRRTVRHALGSAGAAGAEGAGAGGSEVGPGEAVDRRDAHGGSDRAA